MSSNFRISLTSRNRATFNRGPNTLVGRIINTAESLISPSEPVGYSLLADTIWSTLSPQPTGWYGATVADFPNKQPSIQSESGPFASTSYRIRWLNEQTDGYGSFVYPTSPVSAREYFYSFVFKTSPAWVNESSGTKILYPNQGPDAGTIFVIISDGAVDSGTYKWQCQTQPGDGSNTNFNQNIDSAYACSNDTWYRVEVQMVRGTPGGNDGQLRCWLSAWNGTSFPTATLVMEHTNVRYIQAGGSANWTVPQWIFYRGGSGTPTLTADQYIYINRTYVSYKV